MTKKTNTQNIPDANLKEFDSTFYFSVGTYDEVRTRQHLEKYFSEFVENLKKDSAYVFSNTSFDFEEKK